ncbi:MAG: hypothetical protein ACOYIR_06205 [Christensenellales bacterium]|jgi:hypothetical protein
MVLDKERFYKLYDAAMGELDDICEPEMGDEEHKKGRAEYSEALSDFYHYAFGGVPVDVLWEVAKELHNVD